MRPLTLILLAILLGILVFFGYNIYQSRKMEALRVAASKPAVSATTRQNFKLKVNSNSIWIDSKEQIMDSPVREIDGRTMVPVKFLLDFFKAQNVKYDAATEEITFELELPANKAPKNSNITNESQNSATVLTQERQDKIKRIIALSTTYYKLNNMEMKGNIVSIWIDMRMEPKSIEDIRNHTDALASEASFVFDGNQDIKVIAIRTDPGKESFKTYGSSQFTAETGKIEFTEEKN